MKWNLSQFSVAVFVIFDVYLLASEAFYFDLHIYVIVTVSFSSCVCVSANYHVAILKFWP